MKHFQESSWQGLVSMVTDQTPFWPDFASHCNLLAVSAEQIASDQWQFIIYPIKYADGYVCLGYI